VDGDLLCLLARKLLQSHSTLRIILMSATVHTELYGQYFSSSSNNNDGDNDEYYGDMNCLSGFSFLFFSTS
jgi:hypothetical protein